MWMVFVSREGQRRIDLTHSPASTARDPSRKFARRTKTTFAGLSTAAEVENRCSSSLPPRLCRPSPRPARVAKCPKAGRLRVHSAMPLAVTPWLNRRLPSAGPKSDGLFCKLSLLFACLCGSDASRAPSSGVCAAQPHTHQRILLQPRIRHCVCSLRTQCWPSCRLAS